MNNNINLDPIPEKIKNEKKRRHQIYSALEYLDSHNNKFDFFSYDCIKILQTSKNLTKKFGQKKVTSELLLLSFFNSNSELLKFLTKFNISVTSLEKVISYAYGLEENSKNSKSILKFFQSFSNDNQSQPQILDFNYEVITILEKSIENSFRFKTPIINSEILFLTLLEDKNLSTSPLLKTFLKTDLDWNLLRYEILKKLHNQETKIQGNLEKSLRYFAYLLKTELDDNQFEKLLEKDNFSSIILTYRDLVISKVLKIDIFNQLEKDIKLSIKINNKRNYSI
jgi:hypothetical protein